jgi:hypothetical protein
MNKKLFLAGVALLAAIGFTSCNSDMPIDSSNPSGIAPTVVGHEVGLDYDWKAVVKDYAQLQEYWAKDKDAVKNLLSTSGSNTANIFIGLANYDLSDGKEIVLPDFWQTGLTNGKVVNIIFTGVFKNADFERKSAIAGDGTAFPVKINVNNLMGAEVNFTFDVEKYDQKFDLHLASREARSTFSGDFTIGYMLADADVKMNDAIELKAGTVEGLDLQSTGKFKGTFDGVWTKNNELFTVASNGIVLACGEVAPGAKNVFVEDDAAVDTWYNPGNNTNKQYKLGTVKFVQKPGIPVWFYLWGTDKNGKFITEDAIEYVLGFDKADCFVSTGGKAKALDNIDAMEKVTVNGYTELKKDIFTDVEFASYVDYSTKNVGTFADVTFNALWVYIHDHNQTLAYNNVNFKYPVTLSSTITDVENTGVYYRTYQWIIDTTPSGGHYELVTDTKPLLQANSDKEVKVYESTDIDYDPATLTFKKVNGSNDQLNEAKSSYVVMLIDRDWDFTTYIPEGTNVLLNTCKFLEPGNGKLNTTLTSLNYIWGDKVLYDEQCWYTVYVDSVEYLWKKATWGHTGSGSARFVLTPPAANQ